MKLKNKIVVLKSYSFFDIVDKIINYPFYKIKYLKQRKKLLNIRNYVVNNPFPSVEDYMSKIDERIIVSVTSFPKRFDQLVLTLKSIIMQNIVPKKIVVYFGSDTCIEDISDDMNYLKKYNVEYKIDSSMNLKGHKKYFYALKEFKNNIVITIDDDIIFPRTMIEELIKCYEKYPNAVCARRVHKITSKKSCILPYNLWDKEYCNIKKPSNRLFATTGAGTLYSPYVINHLVDSTFDSDRIINLCLDADDVWMKCMETLSSIKVVLADNDVMGDFIDVDEKYTLMPENVGKGKNDIFFKQVCDYYKIDNKLFLKNK